MLDRTRANINLNALSNNLRVVKAMAKTSKVIAMVKCNAYGHGAIKVAQAIAEEVDLLGVMFLREALELTAAGIDTPIIILTGFLSGEELSLIDQHGFDIVIHNFSQVAMLEQIKLTRKLSCWLKIDSGMHRLGFQKDQVIEAYSRLRTLDNVKQPLRFLSHFAESDNPNSLRTLQQLTVFREAVKNFPGERCLANSAAILHWSATHADFIRPGILLYGVSPLAHGSGLDLDLVPVMTLTAPIIAIHQLDRGEKIGYDGIFITPRAMTIGTLAIGYGDGYPRSAIDPPALINGKRTTLLGRVAMDMVAIDLTGIADAKIGTEAVLWGKGLPIEEVARAANVIPYELFTRLTTRVTYNFQ